MQNFQRAGQELCRLYICKESVAVFKEYNLRCHHETRQPVLSELTTTNWLPMESRFIMLVVAEKVFLHKKFALNAVSLSAPTTTTGEWKIWGATCMTSWKRRCLQFEFFVLAMDESSDVQDTAQLLIFILGVGYTVRPAGGRFGLGHTILCYTAYVTPAPHHSLERYCGPQRKKFWWPLI